MRNVKTSPTARRLVDHLLTVNGRVDPALRRSVMIGVGLEPPALDALVTKVALRPTTITDKDLDAVVDAGFTEEQLFEIVVCAAVGQAERQYAAGLTALAATEPTGR